jgi:hypothetical protein
MESAPDHRTITITRRVALLVVVLIAAAFFALGLEIMTVREFVGQVMQGIPAVLLTLALGQRQ